VPFLQHLFRFSLLHPADVAICIAAGVVSIIWFEALKLVNRNTTVPLA
jgi:Ca2+-transporting ATPase